MREKGLNALRQLIDEIDASRFPGLYLLITGTPSFYDSPQGIQKLSPLAQRLQVDFSTDARFDNPRAIQIRLPGFTLDSLVEVGVRVRDIFSAYSNEADRITTIADRNYIEQLARAIAGTLGNRVGIAPRVFLKKLVSDILDRIEQFPDFDPRIHYALTVSSSELNEIERNALRAGNVDEIELEL